MLDDMLNKLQQHLLPFFGDYRVDEITEDLIEEYLEHKQRENDRLAALAASGQPALNKAGRPHRPLKPITINSHLHLLAGILDRAVRDGMIARNPARGEDLRLAVRREHRYGLELDGAWSLIEAAGDLDRAGSRADQLREQVIALRAQGLTWTEIGLRLGKAPSTCIHHAQRTPPRAVPLRRAIVATLTLGGVRIGELCALTCAQVDLAHRLIRVVDAKTPVGVRAIDIHDDLLDELTAYKQSLGSKWQPTDPAFPNRRGRHYDRHAISRHVIAPAVARANALRAEQGLPPIGQHVTPTRFATRTSPPCSPPAPTRSTSPPRSATRTSPPPTGSTATCSAARPAEKSAPAAGSCCRRRRSHTTVRGMPSLACATLRWTLAIKADKGRASAHQYETRLQPSEQKWLVYREIDDGETRTRTGDTTIFSRVLYQLSYLALAGRC
jgi:integrase